jgi:hypothetical protein
MGTPAEALTRLEAWYERQCDGEWEHTYGVALATLDNPGWTVRVDLLDTPLADRAFDKVEIHRSEDDWLVCKVENGRFEAACGPRNLTEALIAFLDWSD